MEFVNVDHPDTLFLAPGVLSVVVECPTDADLHGALGVQQTFFDRAAERRAVRVLETAKIAIPGVGVRIKMHHADGAIFGQGPHDGQGGKVVAADSQWCHAGITDPVKKCLGARHRVHHIHRVDWRVAQVCAVAQGKGVDAAGPIHIADHRG